MAQKQNQKNRRVYEKPVLKKDKGLVFPREIMNKLFNDARFCVQCSGCHGCR